jgi:GNAT superfamily N-acetyltransferase
MEIRALRESDDRTAFRSGDLDLDRFFQRFAGQNQFRHHIGVTYVALDERRLLAYCTLSVGHIEIDALPAANRKKLPRYPLPVLRLARLAVDETARGGGVGKRMLRFVLRTAVRLSQEVGCVGVLVDAKEGAVAFYERFGFVALDAVEGASAARPQPLPMFLPVREITSALD